MRCILALALFSIISCTSEEVIVPIKGSFIYGGQGLNTLHLESGTVTKTVDTPLRLIKYFDFVSGGKLLVSVYELTATKHREKIEIWSRNGNVLQEFGFGSNAVFFDEQGIVVFHNSKGDLVYQPLFDDSEKQEIIERNNRFQNKPVVKTSDSTFLFVKEVTQQYEIFEFSLLTRTASVKPEFKGCSLDKSLWISNLNSMLCQQREQSGKITGKYFLVDTSGEFTALDFGVKGAWPITMFNNDSLLLLQERASVNFGTKEAHPLWVYDFDQQKTVKVVDDIYITGMSRPDVFLP